MKSKQAGKGVSIRGIHLGLAVAVLLISVLLLVVTFKTRSSYYRMRQSTENYIRCENEADELQRASDYLTEQVRCYVETGKREYLDNYFKEAHVTRRREKALETLRELTFDDDACARLEAAMQDSVALMDREYRAMRMTVAAYGYDVSEYPEEIRGVELTEEEALWPRQRQKDAARGLVFDDVYHKRKDSIANHVQECLDILTEEVDIHQKAATGALDRMLTHERTLIFLAIIATLFALALTTLLVISPLLRAVVFIRADEPIPVRGSNEFQFLAKTYNLMYEANQEKTERLTYEATHDKLTGLHNRGGYEFFFKNTDWDNSALLLIDVDKFKQINDRRGHETGDAALRRVAEVLRGCFRSQDHVCRLGGDEFAVIMVHTGPESSDMVKGKIRRINDALVQAKDGLPSVHISCGVAYGRDRSDADEIFREADAALYSVKAAGGCGCSIAA